MNMSTLCTIKNMNRSFKVIILLLFIKNQTPKRYSTLDMLFS